MAVESSAGAADLGTLVFERKPSRGEAMGILITGVVLAAVSAVVPLFAGNVGYFATVLGGATGIGVIIFGFVKLAATKTTYLVHEHGLIKQEGGASRTVRFADVRDIKLEAWRVTQLGGIMGKSYQRVTLTTHTGSPIVLRDD
ncbi:MAG TPA: DUF6585 family protein, partial [Tepidisphaeraceae bacterium]|nr:DUF6585 family protein [Tepidisphaeraceae bacterium]